MKKIFTVSYISLLTLLPLVTNAQLITGYIPEIFPVSKCTDGSYMQLNVTNPGTLVITFPNNITYKPGSVTGATEVSFTTNTATFDVTTPGMVQYTHLSTCASDENATYTDNASLNGSPQFVSNVYNVAEATPQATAITNLPSVANVGSPFTRTVQITNGGLGDVTDWYYQDISDAGSYNYNLNSITFAGGVPFPAANATVTTGAGHDTLTLHFTAAEMLLQGNNDIYFDGNFGGGGNENFNINYTLTPISCGVGYSINSSNRVFFGCEGSICSDVSISSNTNLNIAPPPNLSFTFSGPTPTCMDTNLLVPRTLRVVNTGGAATDLKLIIQNYYAYGNYYGYNSYIDTNTIKLKLNSGPLIGVSPDSILPNGYVWSGDILTAGAQYKAAGVVIKYPIIGPSDTLYINFDLHFGCEGNDNCVSSLSGGFNSYEEQIYVKSGSFYKNACRDVNYNIPETGFNFNGIYLNTTLVYPSDMVGGDTADFNSFVNFENYLGMATGSYMEVQTYLPPGYLIVDSAYGASTNSANATYYWPPVNSLNGNLYTSRFYYPIPANFDTKLFDYKLKLTLDCSLRSPADPLSIKQKWLVKQDTFCTCTRTLTCLENTPTLHCPSPCPEGINNLYAGVLRKNIGLPDANNDGVADAGPYDFSKMNLKTAMWGDTVEYTYAGIVNWNPANGPFSNYYAESSIPGSNGKLTTIDADVSLYSGGVLVNGPTTYPLTAIGDLIKTDFSALAPSVTLGDSIVTKMRLKFTDPAFIQNSSDEKNYESINYMYASRSPNPAPADTSAVSGRRYCDSWSGTFLAVPYYYTYSLYNLTIDGCSSNSSIYSISYLSIGKNGTFNYSDKSLRFPYEVRQWAYADKAKFVLPASYNFEIDSARASYYRTAGLTYDAKNYNNIPFTVNGDTITVDLKSKYAEFGGPADNPISDDGWVVYTFLYLRPKCNTITVTQPYESQIFSKSYQNKLPTDFEYVRNLGISGISVQANTVQLVAAGGGNKNVAGRKFDFGNIQISNQALTNATYAYAYFTTSNKTNITKVTLGGTTILPDANGYFNLNGFTSGESKFLTIEGTTTSCTPDSIKMFYGWDCKQFPNAAPSTLTNCGTPLLFILRPLPAKIDGTVTPLTFTPPNPATGTGTYGQNTVDMCAPFPVEIVINSALQGTIYDINALVKLPQGVSYVPGSAYYEAPSGSTPVPISAAQEAILAAAPPAGLLNFDVELMSNGTVDSLQGTVALPADVRKMKIRFLAQTSCNVSKGRVLATLFAKRACGNNAVGNGTIKGGNSINLTPPSGSFNVNVLTGIAPIQGCGVPSPGFINIVKNDAAIPTNTDSITLAVPSSIDLLNFSCATCTPSLGAPNIYDDGISTTYSWNYPVGNVTGSITINFEAQANDFAICSNANEVSAAVSQLKGLYCASAGAFCPGLSSIEAGVSNALFATNLSKLSIDSLSATIYPYGATNDISATAVVSNTSNINATNYTLLYGYDTDGDGIYSEGVDSLITTVQRSLAANSVDTFTHFFTTPVPFGGFDLITAIITDNSILSTCACEEAYKITNFDVVTFGSIGNYVWEDQNGDGLANEPVTAGINGETVYLYNASLVKIDSTITTNNGLGNPGYYIFDSLASGIYFVEFPKFNTKGVLTITNNTVKIDSNSDANVSTGLTSAITINSTGSGQDKDNTTIDAGYRGLCSVGDYVWYDANNNGIQDTLPDGLTPELPVEGVTINLYNSSGTLIDTKVTDATGFYLFQDLLPGSYYINTPGKVGYSFTLPNQAPNNLNSDVDPATGNSNVFTLVNGDLDDNWDIGIYRAPELIIQSKCNCHNILYSRGDTFEFIDSIKVIATPGAGWTISAQTGMKLSIALSNVSVPIGTALLPFTTPGEFYYEFTHDAGVGYSVTVTDGATSLSTSDLCDAVQLKTSIDTLLNICGAEAPVLLTADYLNGAASVPGTYKFHVVDYTIPRTDSNVTSFNPQLYNALDSVIVYCQFIPTDVALYCPMNYSYQIDIDSAYLCQASLGNRVWVDSNTNGIQDNGEPSHSGDTVKLFSSGLDGIPNTSDDIFIDDTLTDANGYYLFTGLNAGNYFIQFIPSGSFTFTTAPTAGDNENNSNSDANPNTSSNYGYTPNINLSLREIDTTIDAGLVYVIPFSNLAIMLNALQNEWYNNITWKSTSNDKFIKYVLLKGKSANTLLPIHEQEAIKPNNFIDNEISIGATYYQINGIDKDGKMHASNVSIVNRKDQRSVSLYPNPASSSINLRFTEELAEDQFIKIYDQIGKLVKIISVSAGSKVITISIAELSSGVYDLSIQGYPKAYKFTKY
jgi:hypothetical protein